MGKWLLSACTAGIIAAAMSKTVINVIIFILQNPLAAIWYVYMDSAVGINHSFYG